MRSTQGPNNDYSKRHWPAMSKYSPPEVQKNSSMDLTEAQVCIYNWEIKGFNKTTLYGANYPNYRLRGRGRSKSPL